MMRLALAYTETHVVLQQKSKVSRMKSLSGPSSGMLLCREAPGSSNTSKRSGVMDLARRNGTSNVFGRESVIVAESCV